MSRVMSLKCAWCTSATIKEAGIQAKLSHNIRFYKTLMEQLAITFLSLSLALAVCLGTLHGQPITRPTNSSKLWLKHFTNLYHHININDLVRQKEESSVLLLLFPRLQYGLRTL